MSDPIAHVELGGSSSQTARRDEGGRWTFADGIHIDPDQPYALACPGAIDGGRVRWATNLGWPDDADPREQLGRDRLILLMNDACAAGLGEAVLRDSTHPPDLLYLVLGTGVGSTIVRDGAVWDADLGHAPMGGDRFCASCWATGCLNSILESTAVPHPLSADDIALVADTLARLLQERVDPALPVVLAGGIVRSHPAIIAQLMERVSNPVSGSAAPTEAKSASPIGLAYQVDPAGMRPIS